MVGRLHIIKILMTLRKMIDEPSHNVGWQDNVKKEADKIAS